MQQETNTYKILVAEDNDFVRMQIVKFLADAGYEVEEYATAAEAVPASKKGHDAAIVDVRMEPMGGFDFLKSMRSDGVETPAILITGDQNPDLLNDASKLGAAAVLIKPVQKDRLLKTVERTIKMQSRRAG